VVAVRGAARLQHRRGGFRDRRPATWLARAVVKVQNANTAAPSGEPLYTGLCLDKEDLCVAKLCAFREKDQNFVAALLETRLVDAEVIAKRLPEVPSKHHPSAERALAWLTARG
jgi:hypothetical protein